MWYEVIKKFELNAQWVIEFRKFKKSGRIAAAVCPTTDDEGSYQEFDTVRDAIFAASILNIDASYEASFWWDDYRKAATHDQL